MRRAAVAGLVVVLAACSGGDGLTKAQFITRADRICADFTAAGADLKTPTSADDVEPYLAGVLRLADDARTDLAALDPPAGGEAARQALLDALDATMDRARDAQAAAGQHDLGGVQQALNAAASAAVKANEVAKAYGFQDCAGL